LGAAAALLVASPADAKEKKAASSDSGWVDLLPGGNLTKHWTTKGNWKVNDGGVVTLTPREGEKGWARFDAYLWSEKQYKNFEIEFEYKVQKRGNSGFYFHVSDKKSPVRKGIEVQIYDSARSDATGTPGEVVSVTDDGVTVAAEGGAILIKRVRPAGGQKMPAAEWAETAGIARGMRLGT